MRSPSRRAGFSLVELMIVVAIIGILAAIAIPNFNAMMLKARRAEVAPNVEGIRTHVQTYDMVNDTYLPLPQNPTSTPGKAPRAFSADAQWTKIGWTPDGLVRGSYEVTMTGPLEFQVHGWCDVDGEGTFHDVRGTRDVKVEMDAGDENVY
jgi:prepilin-type N-terminal cleavage/methylation domain-containing protein